jgi:hypothetical protein
MFPTRQAPDARAGEAPIIEAYDLAGAGGEDAIDAPRTPLVPPPAEAPPAHRPLGLQLDLVDGAGMAPPDPLRDLSVAVVVT